MNESTASSQFEAPFDTAFDDSPDAVATFTTDELPTGAREREVTQDGRRGRAYGLPQLVAMLDLHLDAALVAAARA